MVTKYAMDLFNDPFFIGFNRELNRLNTAHKTNSQSYPPYDLIKLDEDTYKISLAVAGFSKEDIDVSVDNGTLIIRGEIVEVTDAKSVVIKTEKMDSSEKYGRILGWIYINDETVSLNDMMINDGYAWGYLGDTKVKDFDALAKARKKSGK